MSEVTRVGENTWPPQQFLLQNSSPELALYTLSLEKRSDDFLKATLKCVLSTRVLVKGGPGSTADLGKF